MVLQDDYLVTALNEMSAAIYDGRDWRNVRNADWDQFFDAACLGLRKLTEDHKRIEQLADQNPRPWTDGTSLTK
jgi:hypothetical protein